MNERSGGSPGAVEVAAARQPHAKLDHVSRANKAAKIVAQIQRERTLADARILDIGCGGGLIAHELSQAAGSKGEVWGVDVEDLRTITEGYRFSQVSGTALPFENGEFDVVVSNHCIEHVGGREDQVHHLQEARRVLRDDGLCYLALPNHWTVVEPHFKLPFLSWLPARLRTPYVRLARRGERYDCDIPLTAELARMIEGAGLRAKEITVEAMPLIAEIEQPGYLKRKILTAPGALMRPLQGLMPTRMYVLRKS
jgi:ubiquinone/menaquinone biosynthesis C-methylase UbiE